MFFFVYICCLLALRGTAKLWRWYENVALHCLAWLTYLLTYEGNTRNNEVCGHPFASSLLVMSEYWNIKGGRSDHWSTPTTPPSYPFRTINSRTRYVLSLTYGRAYSSRSWNQPSRLLLLCYGAAAESTPSSFVDSMVGARWLLVRWGLQFLVSSVIFDSPLLRLASLRAKACEDELENGIKRTRPLWTEKLYKDQIPMRSCAYVQLRAS